MSIYINVLHDGKLQHKTCSFLHNLLYIVMVVLMCFQYGTSDKATYMLYSGKFRLYYCHA